MATLADRIGQLSPDKIRQLADAINRRKASPSGPVLHRHEGYGDYPLSLGQERLWFLDQLAPATAAYNWPFGVRFEFALDPDVFRRTLIELARRHEVLRTTYPVVDNVPVQRVGPPVDALRIVDLRGGDRPSAERAAIRLIAENARTPFDLTRGPLCRYQLIQLADADWMFAGTMHHSVVDGWSRRVLMDEIIAIWRALALGIPIPLSELPLQYGDYAIWQREWLAGPAGERLLAYWTRQLADTPILDLPTDYPRPPIKSFVGATETLALPKALTEKLRALSRQENATLFMTLLAAFQTLLMRYTGETDVAVAIPVASRDRVELERLIGFFVNTLVARVDLSGNPTFRELLRRVRGVCLDAYAHQAMPFERLVEVLQPRRDLSRSPIAQVIFQLEDIPKVATGSSRQAEQGTAKPLDIEIGSAIFDIHVHLYEGWDTAVIERPEGITGTFTYEAELFSPQTIRRLIGHYVALLEAIAEDPNRRLARLPLISDAERREFSARNQTGRDFSGGRTVVARFEEQAARTPQARAVVAGTSALTYSELNLRANQLARHLRRLGAVAETRIAVCTDRSAHAIVAMLGVMKAGCASVPLDPEYPTDRLRRMIADARAPIVLTERAIAPRLDGGDVATLSMDADWDRIAAESEADPGRPAAPENLAYVMYTSGSTGQPKGVAVEHRQLVNYVDAIRSRLDLDGALSFAHVSTFAADLGHTMLYPALCGGGTLHLLSRDQATSPADLAAYFSTHAIDCLKITPSHFEGLVVDGGPDAPVPARRLVFGGEALDRDLVDRVRRLRPGSRIFNHYGPTECTVGALACDATEHVKTTASGTVPIGTPLANLRAYVLDATLTPMPAGTAGELYLGGAGVARGYLEQPAATADRFVADPFGEHPGARMYRTGDRARCLDDGCIEFLGRADDQVKIRGYRVETGDVEHALVESDALEDAAIVVRRAGGEPQLVACIVPRDRGGDAGRLVHDVREHLRARVPPHMMPAAFAVLDRMPLLASGKIDRRSLRDVEVQRLEPSAFVAPRDAIELRLAHIWEQTLGVQRIGVTDNFFDAGGHSLLAVRAIGRIQQEFEQTVTLLTLFQKPTIEQLAAVLRQGSTTSAQSPLVPLHETGGLAPLFLVHPAGGTIMCYFELARQIGPDRPVYALQFQGFTDASPFVPVETMAARYIEAIRTVRPSGPYVLGGWSLGGAIAFEMAAQLTAQGDAVPAVLLIDTHGPVGGVRANAASDAGLLTVANRIALFSGGPFPISEDEFRALGYDRQLEYIVAQMRARRIVPEEVDAAWVRAFVTVFENNLAAMQAYSPRRYAGTVVQFRSEHILPAIEEEYRDQYRQRDLGWQPSCARDVMVREVPGNHVTMLTAPHVSSLAESVRGALAVVEQSLAGTSVP